MRALWLVLLIGCAADKSAEAPMGSASTTPASPRVAGGGGGLSEDPCGGGQISGKSNIKADKGVVAEETPAPSPDISGSIDREEIVRIVKGSAKALRACYEANGAGGTYKLVITFTIATDGSVSKADVTGGPAALTTCVVGVAKSMKFPAASAPTTIRYPITMSSS